MPDLPSRNDWERKLARLMGRYFQEGLDDLIDALYEDPDKPENLNNLTQEQIDKLNDWRRDDLVEARVSLRDALQAIYLEGAEGEVNSQPIGVDWGLLNERAIRWAEEYSYDLVKGIKRTTQRSVDEALTLQRELRETIPTGFEAGVTQRDLRRRLSETFGPRRAAMIAVTEVTRASVQGTMGFMAQLRHEGVRVVAIHRTNKDERVCPICKPRDGKPIENIYQEPPLHVNCRCWVTARVVRNE